MSVTQTEILRTILNLPIRCPSRSLLSITGMLSISAMILHKQLNFLHSFSLLPADSLPRQLFQALTTSISPNYTTSKLQTLLHQHCLPPITAIPSLQLSKRCWKQAMKRILWAAQLADFLVSCSHLPLAQCSVLHRGNASQTDFSHAHALAGKNGLGTPAGHPAEICWSQSDCRIRVT